MVRRAKIKVKWALIALARDSSNDDHGEAQVQLGAVDKYILKLVRDGIMRIPVEFVRPNAVGD
jgi:hypothetical protein